MSSHKPQTIWEMPSFLIRSSAVKNGIWWLALKWYWVCEEGRRSRETGMWRVPICVFACVTGAVCVWERESLKRDVKKETEYRVSCLRAQFGGFSKSCGSKSDRAAKVKQCTGMHEDFYNFTLILHITTRLWTPYCSLSARSCTACGTRSQTVSEMLVGCSVWLPFTERPSPPKCWLPWRQL